MHPIYTVTIENCILSLFHVFVTCRYYEKVRECVEQSWLCDEALQMYVHKENKEENA